MALVKNPFYSGEASGQVGALVAARNRTGPYIRQNAKPVQPRTPTQTKQRYDFVGVSNEFLNLSTTRVEAWNDFANNYTVTNRLGDSTRIIGRNWFIALNSRLLRGNVSVVYEPPLNPEPTFLPGVSLGQTASGESIVVGLNASLTGNNRLWVYGTGALTKTRRFKSGSMRLLTIFQTMSAVYNYTLIDSTDLVFDNSSYQFETRSVDANGRATAPLRFTVFPESI
jgi:hypothetical protein